MSDNAESLTLVADKTRQSLIWYTSVPFFIHFLRFANSILLARILLPSDFGIIGIISVILYYCDSFTDFGFSKALIQRPEASAHHFRSYFTFNFIVSLLFVFGAYAASDAIAGFYEISELADAIKVFSLLFLITAFSAAPKTQLKRDINFKTLAKIEAIKVAVAMSTSLTLALNNFGFWSIIYGMLVSRTVALLLLVKASRFTPSFTLDLRPLRELLNFSAWDFIGAQFNLVAQSADKLIIGKVLGATALGHFDKALGLARMANDQVSIRLSGVSFSSFSRLRDDKSELSNYFFKIIILTATLLFPVFIGLILVAEDFVVVLLGENWLPMVFSLKILSLAFIFSSLSNPVIAINHSMALVKQQSLIAMLLTASLVVGLLNVAEYGIEAACFVILAVSIFRLFFSFLLLNAHSRFGWGMFFSSLAAPVLLVVCMAGLVTMFYAFNTIQTRALELFLAVGIGAFSYASLFLLLPLSNLGFLRRRMLKRLAPGLVR